MPQCRAASFTASSSGVTKRMIGPDPAIHERPQSDVERPVRLTPVLLCELQTFEGVGADTCLAARREIVDAGDITVGPVPAELLLQPVDLFEHSTCTPALRSPLPLRR